MTNEEAMKYIIQHCNPDYPKGKTEWETAMNMAISALEKQDVPEINVGDLISRNAAIDAKQEFRNPNVVRNTEARTAYDRTYANGWNDCNLAWIDAIKALPSAHPEHNQNTPQKQPDSETLGAKTGETCADAISRQDAVKVILADKIDATSLKVMTALGDGRLALTLNDACDRHIRAIEQLPSAQPERKKGLWKVIRYNGDMQRYARCKCGYEYGAGKFDGLKFVALKLHNFCPNCGAKMEVEE